MADYLIGVDVGTQGTKTCLFDAGGRLVSSAFEPSNLIMPEAGVCEQDADELYGSVVRTIKSVMEQSGVAPSAVAAIGMDGQMAGIMGIGEDFSAATPYDSWLDMRCGGKIQEMKQQAGGDIIRICGAPVSYNHGPKVLWWKDERPEVYKKIRKFVLPVTYIAGRMCSLSADDAWIDHTCFHFSGFGDIQKLEWSDALLSEFGVDGDKMPRVAHPWEIVGRLSEESAAECGLLPGTPVAAGAGDQAATSLGAGIVKPGLAFDVAGTASVFSCCTDGYHPDVENGTIIYARSILPELWVPLAYINGGGLCVRWIRDILKGEDERVTYDSLAAEAEKVAPGSENLLFIPHFSGRVCPNDPDVRGSFAGLTMRHGRAHMYRAVMESIGYEYAMYKRILSETAGFDINEVYAIGGGAKSPLFNSIKADILGITYTALETSDTGSWGAAIAAGYGVGLLPDMAEAATYALKKTGSTCPDAARHAAYQPHAARYPMLIEALHELYRTM